VALFLARTKNVAFSPVLTYFVRLIKGDRASILSKTLYFIDISYSQIIGTNLAYYFRLHPKKTEPLSIYMTRKK
jgi:hypothetical protein